MLPGGLVDTGDFAIQVHELFDGKSATFSMLPEEQIPGSGVTRLDFSVPAEHSGLLVNQTKESSGYHGQVYVDPATLDPRHIRVIVELRPKLVISAATRELTLARVATGAGDFLLPQSADVSMTRLDGVGFFNHIEFKSCRQFTGDSVLKFDDPVTPPSNAGTTAPREIIVPAGLYFQVRPEEGFDLTDRAVGDPIRVKLDQDLKSKSTVLFAKGAMVEGRITRLTRTSNVTLLGITLEAIVSLTGKAAIHPAPYGISVPRPLAPRTGFNPSRGPTEAIIALRSGVNILSSAILIFWRT